MAPVQIKRGFNKGHGLQFGVNHYNFEYIHHISKHHLLAFDPIFRSRPRYISVFQPLDADVVILRVLVHRCCGDHFQCVGVLRLHDVAIHELLSKLGLSLSTLLRQKPSVFSISSDVWTLCAVDKVQVIEVLLCAQCLCVYIKCKC